MVIEHEASEQLVASATLLVEAQQRAPRTSRRAGDGRRTRGSAAGSCKMRELQDGSKREDPPKNTITWKWMVWFLARKTTFLYQQRGELHFHISESECIVLS